MPYSAAHKARTRARIVDSARKLFNRHGFQQVSIDQIMQGAGLTRGGFYHHFGSKDELYAAAVASFSSCNPLSQHIDPSALPEPAKLARLLVDLYLSDAVLADIDSHCPLYALPGDVARAGLPPQQAYTTLIRNMAGVFGQALDGHPERDMRAQTVVSLCVGGMVLARTTDDPALRVSLRQAAHAQACTLLGV